MPAVILFLLQTPMTYQSTHSLVPSSTGDREGGGSQGTCHDFWTFKKPKTKPGQQKVARADTSYLWALLGLLGREVTQVCMCTHQQSPLKAVLGKSWKMLPRPLLLLLPFLPIIKVKTSEFFLGKKQTEHSHNISCWGTLWGLADLQVQLKAGIWTGGVALQ